MYSTKRAFHACSASPVRVAFLTLPDPALLVLGCLRRQLETPRAKVRVWSATSNRAKAAARLDLEVSAGWAILSSHGLWGGDALLLSSRYGVLGFGLMLMIG